MAYVGIVVNNKDLIENADKSFLAADIASGVSSLTLESTQRFYTNQIIVIGEIGTERTEIIKTHAVTTPSGQTLTLASATARAHQRGDPVYIINYDRYELSHATTATGSKTTLTITGVDSALGSGLIQTSVRRLWRPGLAWPLRELDRERPSPARWVRVD